MTRISRRSLLAAGTAAILTKPSAAQAAPERAAAPLILNDASRLNPTPVARHAIFDAREDARTVAGLRALLKEAQAAGRPVAMGGARHSMGGQSLPHDGFAASLTDPDCRPDAQAQTYRVRAGTRWRDVIGVLDPLGFSPAVMQSNSDFTVGGTLSVNAHGWPVAFGPFGTTLRSFRIMLADGTLLTCSRSENAELFALAIGGYGLFGIVLDAEIETTGNAMLTASFELVPAARLAGRFTAAAKDASVRMAYGRLPVARDNFLEEGLVVSYRPVRPLAERPPTAQRLRAYSFVSRTLFRAQTGSERGKAARWYAESVLLPRAARPVTRNSILNHPVSALADRDRSRADILHEYFLPAERFAEFLIACREIIPPSLDPLNVTLRHVEADPLSVLAYAPGPRIAAVMLFTQPLTAQADAAMRAATEQLIDAALKLGGSFYLPYRLHARADQVRAAYPRLGEFLAKKRHYDPQGRFRNLMWDRYFA